MIHVLAVFTAFLCGTLLEMVLAGIRTRRRQVEEDAKRVAAALSDADTVLVDDVELPRPEDERWTRASFILSSTGAEVQTMTLGAVSVSAQGWVYVEMLALPSTARTKAYAASVWQSCRTRATRKSLAP